MTTCEVCGAEVDVNGFCIRGCDDERDLEPLRPTPTSRDRFGNRNR